MCTGVCDMTDKLSSDRIDEIVDCISQEKDGDISLADLLTLSKVMIESLEALIAERDGELGSEVSAIAGHIEKTQIELDGLEPNGFAEQAIPEADEDLKEVVGATEKATETILESAERIMSANDGNHEEYRQIVDEAVINIFEACCFQDITGQRINRVVETLTYISQHMTYITGVLTGGERIPVTAKMPRGNDLLQGPQSTDDAISQDDADSLFDFSANNVVPLKN